HYYCLILLFLILFSFVYHVHPTPPPSTLFPYTTLFRSPNVGHLMRDDQMMRNINSDLDVVAHDTGAPPARRHRAGIRIGQRYLLVRCGEHTSLEGAKALHLLFQLGDLLLEATHLGFECLRRLLPVGG